jgi:dihydrofolate reductase
VALVAAENVSLDGVMQSPARPEEDTRGGFDLGGWGIPYGDEVSAREMGKRMARPGSILLGRWTYENFYSVWPGRTDNPYTQVLNRTQKYVVSRTLQEPLPWMNSTLLRGPAEESVAELKRNHPDDIAILGSGELVRSLMRAGLVDELLLSIAPLVLGRGRRLFEGVEHMNLELVESVTTTRGVIIATFRLV